MRHSDIPRQSLIFEKKRVTISEWVLLRRKLTMSRLIAYSSFSILHRERSAVRETSEEASLHGEDYREKNDTFKMVSVLAPTRTSHNSNESRRVAVPLHCSELNF